MSNGGSWESEVHNITVVKLGGFSSWWETEAFLKDRQAYLRYDGADLAQDQTILERPLPHGRHR